MGLSAFFQQLAVLLLMRATPTCCAVAEDAVGALDWGDWHEQPRISNSSSGVHFDIQVSTRHRGELHTLVNECVKRLDVHGVACPNMTHEPQRVPFMDSGSDLDCGFQVREINIHVPPLNAESKQDGREYSRFVRASQTRTPKEMLSLSHPQTRFFLPTTETNNPSSVSHRWPPYMRRRQFPSMLVHDKSPDHLVSSDQEPQNTADLAGLNFYFRFAATLTPRVTCSGKVVNYYYFICHPTIAGGSTNILLNFTLHDANAIDNTYTPGVDYSPYQSNVFSNVILCLITSCVSDATLYVRIQSSTKTFVRSTLLIFLEKP